MVDNVAGSFVHPPCTEKPACRGGAMPNHICVTCGIQYPESDTPPAGCPICEDERQYVNPRGQQWTTLEQVQRVYRNAFNELEPGVTAIVNEARRGARGAGGYEGETSWAAKAKFGI